MSLTDFLSGFPPVSPVQWKQKIIEELKGKPFDDLIWRTKEGFDVQPFYTAEDLGKIKITIPQKAKPGWEIRQDILVKDVRDANKNALEAISGGAESIGFNISKIEVTKTNLQKLLGGINTAKHPVHFTGVKMKSLEKLVSVFTKKTSGSVEFSDFSFKHQPLFIKYRKRFRAFRFITIDERTLFSVIKSDSARTSLSEGEGVGVRLSLSSDYFLSIAKLRAIRLFFAEKNTPVFIHAENIPQKTAKGEEHYNILRATTTAMAAVIGGCDSLSLKASPIPGKSKALSKRVYRNIQLLLKHESYLDKVHDPASGSYFVEVMTREMLNRMRQP